METMYKNNIDNWKDNTFLSHVAQDLLLRFGNNLMGVTLVFPNKRARLFMNEELLSKTSSPMWAPEYATIAELFEGIVGNNVCESIPAVCTLYQIYKQLMGSNAESLDKFWGWGEIILSDFDDIDKHLVDANSLFLNAKELDQMESLDFLTENQLNALKQFFGSFTPENKTRLQEQFARLWSVMPELYHGLKDAMPEGVQPYQGALERLAVENADLLSRLNMERTYCFVGFNMLSETEKKLMSYLQKRNKALFYWDYDEMYLKNRNCEAGDFIRQNLERFPNALSKGNCYDNLRHKTEFTFVSTSTDSIATRYIPEWLENHLTPTERETALVLCDEAQLQPTLHSIPDNEANGSPKDINITMGYSIVGTPVHSLILALVALQTEGWDEKRKRFRLPFLKSIKFHPYHQYMDRDIWEVYHNPVDVPGLMLYLDRVLMSITSQMKEDEAFDDVLMVESIYVVHRTLMQFHDMASDAQYPLELHPTTLRRLLRRVFSSLSIPFHGEPAQGLQVMGVLETRCIDFRNLLLLNVGEGYLPKSGADNSIIPYTLRVGFGLTTPRHRIAVFAYYFYRLIQRAEHVTFIYNENSSGNVRHEMSRFLRQLQAETDIPIKCFRLEAEQDSVFTMLDTVPKDKAIMDLMHQKYNLKCNPKARALSPSAMNVYMNCPMQFYISSICGIREQPNPEDGIDPRLLGTIVHNVAEIVYNDIISHSGSKTITRSLLSEYTKDGGKLLQPLIDKEFEKEAGITEFRGENILVRGVVERYLLNLFRWDEKHAPIVMEDMESDMYTTIEVEQDGEKLIINTGGRIDRMDIITDKDNNMCFRILDYKTGAHEDSPKSLNDLFRRDADHASYYFQTFLYALATMRSGRTNLPIRPVLFYTAKAGKDDYNPSLYFGNDVIADISHFANDFEEQLKLLIAEIFDKNKPFVKTTRTSTCDYCDFKKLCGR